MKILIELEKSGNTLITNRNIVNSLFFYLSALLGSTFGMMESFAWIMGLVEWFLDSIEKRRNRKVFVGKTQNVGVMLSSFMKTDLRMNEIAVYETIFENVEKKECKF